MWLRFAIWYFTCLVFTLAQTSGGIEKKLDHTISELCSEKSSMLKRGLSEEMASRIIGNKIKKFSDLMMRGMYPDYIQTLGVKRKTRVGSHGQAVNTNVVGVQESMVSNQNQIVMNQINNYFKKSDVTEFQLNSDPTITMGMKAMTRRGIFRGNPVKSECQTQVKNEIQKMLMRADHFDKKLESRHNPASKNGLSRQSSSSNSDDVAKIFIKENTAVDSDGNGIDLDQMASGSSMNSMTSTITDEQQHSTYKLSKVESEILNIDPDVSLG